MKRIYSITVKRFICLSFLCLFLSTLNANTNEAADCPLAPAEIQAGSVVSPLLIFHDIGWNWVNSVVYNYGANFLVSGLGTWAFIETGLDWNLRNVAYNNAWLANAGLPLLAAGYLVPVITPFPVYFIGRWLRDTKLQVTAAALAQALIITQSFHVPMKLITGRTIPGIISGVFFEPNNYRDDRKEDFSGEFSWFKFDLMDGWPSGHTACAFSAAAVISEIYSDKLFLKIGVYSYAVLMGFSVALNTHWASDSFAGALIGYAVGKVVGKSFNHLLGAGESTNRISFYATPDSIGVILRY